MAQPLVDAPQFNLSGVLCADPSMRHDCVGGDLIEWRYFICSCRANDEDFDSSRLRMQLRLVRGLVKGYKFQLPE